MCRCRKRKQLQVTSEMATMVNLGADERHMEEELFKLRTIMSASQNRGKESHLIIDHCFGGNAGLAKILRTDLETGLDDENYFSELRRRDVLGENKLPSENRQTLMAIILDTANDSMLILLTICGVVLIVLESLPFNEWSKQDQTTVNVTGNVSTTTTPAPPGEDTGKLKWLDGAAILMAVCLCVFVAAITDYRKELEFRKLQDTIAKDTRCTVMRNSAMQEINLEDLLVGDVAVIGYGDFVPADGVIIKSSDLRTDESALTGESDQLRKTPDGDCFVFAGTMVVEGQGRMLVTAVGVSTQSGDIYNMLMNPEVAEKLHLVNQKRRRQIVIPTLADVKATLHPHLGDGISEHPVTPSVENQLANNSGGFLDPADDFDEPLNIPLSENNSRRAITRQHNNTGSNADGSQRLTSPAPTPMLVNKTDSHTHTAQSKFHENLEPIEHQVPLDKTESRETPYKDKKVSLTIPSRSEQTKSQKFDEEEGGKSILKAKLEKVVIRIGAIGLLVAISTIIFLEAFMVIDNFIKVHNKWNWTYVLKFFEPIVIGITILVVAIPEGLPLAVNLALAFSVRKMARDHILVRHVDAGETAGNATTICSDKTGTLTTNKMTCVQSFIPPRQYRHAIISTKRSKSNLSMAKKSHVGPNESHVISRWDVAFRGPPIKKPPEEIQKPPDEIQKPPDEIQKPPDEIQKPPDEVKPDESANNMLHVNPNELVEKLPTRDLESEYRCLLFQSIALNSNQSSNIVEVPGEALEQRGNKTECALLKFINDIGGDYEEVRHDFEKNITQELTFNSARKFMATTVRQASGQHIIYVKGASEKVVEGCRFWLTSESEKEELTAEKSAQVNFNISRMAEQGLRTIGVAYKVISGPTIKEKHVLSDLVLLAVCGIEDPLRPEVPEAIRLCNKAGIRVRMVTGDNVNTARSIARKCGIIPDVPPSQLHSYNVLESSSFNKAIRHPVSGEVDQYKFDEISQHLCVLARSSPADKFILVQHLIFSNANNERQIVAVTGDGTNDAPALKRADVGFAMGIAGTDVAKEACDIIITDDNFYSIVRACMWGRNVYDSVSKFLQFQLTVNVVALIMCFVGAAMFKASPFTPIQMLWINLVMDTLASIALATSPPSLELLNRPPKPRDSPIINDTMWKHLLGQAFYQLGVIMTIVFGHDYLFMELSQCPASAQQETNAHNVTTCLKLTDLSVDWRRVPNVPFSMAFHCFVLMTLFNEVAARNLNNEHNPFRRIFKNHLFLGIWIAEWFLQCIMIEFGYVIIGTVRLNWKQWLICLGAGVVGLFWNVILSFLPAEPVIAAVSRLFLRKSKKAKHFNARQYSRGGSIMSMTHPSHSHHPKIKHNH